MRIKIVNLFAVVLAAAACLGWTGQARALETGGGGVALRQLGSSADARGGVTELMNGISVPMPEVPEASAQATVPDINAEFNSLLESFAVTEDLARSITVSAEALMKDLNVRQLREAHAGTAAVSREMALVKLKLLAARRQSDERAAAEMANAWDFLATAAKQLAGNKAWVDCLTRLHNRALPKDLQDEIRKSMDEVRASIERLKKIDSTGYGGAARFMNNLEAIGH